MSQVVLLRTGISTADTVPSAVLLPALRLTAQAARFYTPGQYAIEYLMTTSEKTKTNYIIWFF